MIHLLHGDEELLRGEALRRLKAGLGAPETADLNTTHFEARSVTLSELQQACATVPFLAPRRLVVVDALLCYLTDDDEKERTPAQKQYLRDLLDYLERVPESTDLAFMEPKSLQRKKSLMQRFEQLEQRQQARIVACARKKGKELAAWIESQTQAKGSRIGHDATELLAQTVGQSMLLLDLEVTKLITYTAGKRRIEVKDVQLLVPEAREARIWDMVDALGMGQGAKAIVELHRLLDDDERPLKLLGMIVRQYRLLLQMKELRARGVSKDGMMKELKLQDFAVDKLARQAHRYTLPQLEAIHERLLETDLAIKTGRLEPVLALDLLVAELSS